MSDHATVAGKTTGSITFRGKPYTIRVKIVGILAEMQDYAASLQGDPIKEVCDRFDSIPPAQQELWLKAAISAVTNRTPSVEEMARFQGTVRGQAFITWACLRPEIIADFPTPAAFYEAWIAEGEEHGQAKLTEIMAKLEVASGSVQLGNSDGRSETAPPAQQQATETPSSAVGQGFTSSLRTSTAGQ